MSVYFLNDPKLENKPKASPAFLKQTTQKLKRLN